MGDTVDNQEVIDPDLTANVKDIATEAREEFTESPQALRDRIKNRGRRTKRFTVAYDELAGEGVTALEAVLDTLTPVVQKATSDIQEQAKQKYAEVEAELETARAEMLKSALTFQLQALPSLIVKDVRRKTRAALGITEKGIPEGREDDFNDRFLLEMIAAQTVSFIDHGEDRAYGTVDIETLQTLEDELPPLQWGKIVTAANDLQFRNVISEAAIQSADF